MKYPQKTFTADGTESARLPGGEYAVHVGGTWGGGTMSVQWDDGINSVEFPSGSLTADGLVTIKAGSGKVNFVLTGATSPSLTVTFDKVS